MQGNVGEWMMKCQALEMKVAELESQLKEAVFDPELAARKWAGR